MYYAIDYFTAPTAVQDLTAVASSLESIYISWNHPQYPNSQLTQYIIYHRANPPMIQLSPNISNDGFVAVEVPVDMLSLNLSGLNTFTNYSIHMSVRGEGVSDAPIEIEIIDRTNSSGKSINIIIGACRAEKSYMHVMHFDKCHRGCKQKGVSTTAK